MKEFTKKYLTPHLKRFLTPQQFVGLCKLRDHLLSCVYADDLKRLAAIHGTDKWGSHWYVQHYEKHFRHLKTKNLKVLEIGVGQGARPTEGGASLRMWKYYFPNSVIYSLDIFDKRALQEDRIKIFQGDQSDEKLLKDIFGPIAPFDIIIDDGSHISKHVIASFKALFPLLKTGGIYVVEDTQTSYFPKMGGDSANLNNPDTSLNFFKNLTDGLNYAEFIRPGYVPSYFDKTIVSMHFYHNLVFIYKGENNEGSNLIVNNDTDMESIK